MRNIKNLLFRPIVVFVVCLLTLIMGLWLFLHWYSELSQDLNHLKSLSPFPGITEIIQKSARPELIMGISGMMVGTLIIGVIIIFNYYRKIHQLYHLQENFLNNFTHELKTPLASLRLYLETFLKYDLSDEERKEFIHFMLRDTERLSLNVQQILQMGRLENRMQQHTREKVHLGLFIQDFLDNNQHLFPKDCLIIQNECAYPPYVFITPNLFDILLMNIFTNAFKYCDQKPKIIITIKENKGILISFQDNGIGLERKNFKVIFDKFQQVTANDTRTVKGTGLGLYSAQQIVKIHNGHMWVDSKGLGTGSTFFIQLPSLKRINY